MTNQHWFNVQLSSKSFDIHSNVLSYHLTIINVCFMVIQIYYAPNQCQKNILELYKSYVKLLFILPQIIYIEFTGIGKFKPCATSEFLQWILAIQAKRNKYGLLYIYHQHPGVVIYLLLYLLTFFQQLNSPTFQA